MQTGLSKKYPEKVHSPEQTERGLDGLRCLSEPTTNFYSLTPNKDEWSYRRRTISHKQSTITLHHSLTSTEQLERYTIMQQLLQAFLPKQHYGCMAK